MGIFSEIKKLFFSVESVSKSGAKKLVEKSKEYKEDAQDNLEEIVDRTKEKFDHLMDAFSTDEPLSQENDSVPVKAEKSTAPIPVNIENDTPTSSSSLEDAIESIGEKSISLGTDLVDKVSTLSENIGKTVLEGAENVSDQLGETLSKAGDSLKDKAFEAADKLSQKLDDTLAKAKEMEDQAAMSDQNKVGIADRDLTTGGSLLDNQDDFFSKAEKMARGEYDNVAPSITQETIPSSATKKSKAYGFNDRDGDGNELIDDAIIEEE